jgi:hypothetical protein
MQIIAEVDEFLLIQWKPSCLSRCATGHPAPGSEEEAKYSTQSRPEFELDNMTTQKNSLDIIQFKPH